MQFENTARKYTKSFKTRKVISEKSQVWELKEDETPIGGDDSLFQGSSQRSLAPPPCCKVLLCTPAPGFPYWSPQRGS